MQLQAPPITAGCCTQVAMVTKDAIIKDEKQTLQVELWSYTDPWWLQAVTAARLI